MRSVTALSQIPTLRQLYANGTLRKPTNTRFQANDALLDRVALIQDDITRLEVDAIVNAANKSLLGGGGVDGAIHRAAGRQLYEECATLNGCETGDAKITKGYNLPSKHVVHTVGPVYSARNADVKAAQLASCYRTGLQLAVNNELRHIAFPSISTGVYGYPIVDATKIALAETRGFLDSSTGASLERVIFVVWGDEDKHVYEDLLPQYFPPSA